MSRNCNHTYFLVRKIAVKKLHYYFFIRKQVLPLHKVGVNKEQQRITRFYNLLIINPY